MTKTIENENNIGLAFFHAIIMPLIIMSASYFFSKENVILNPIAYLTLMSAMYSIRAKLFPKKVYIERSEEFFSFVYTGMIMISILSIFAITIIIGA